MHKSYTPAVARLALKRQLLVDYSRANTDEEKEKIVENLYLDYAQIVEEEKDKAVHARDVAEEHVNVLLGEKELTKNELSSLNIKMQQQQDTLQEEKLKRVETEKELNRTATQVREIRESFSRLDASHSSLLRKVYVFVAITVAFFLGFVLVSLFSNGGLWWLVMSGIQAIAYILGMAFYKPWTRSRNGKVFTFIFPLFIIGSSVFPLGWGREFSEVIGNISNFGGYLALLLYIFSGEDI